MEMTNVCTTLLTEKEAKTRGVKAVKRLGDLFSHAVVSFRRLPFLEVALNRFCHRLSKTLHHLTNEFVEVTVDDLISKKLCDVVPEPTEGALFGIFKSDAGTGAGALYFEPAFINLWVDILLGGGKSAPQSTPTTRAYSPIERNVIDRLMKLIIQELGPAFETHPVTNFTFERQEAHTRCVPIDKPKASVFYGRLKVVIGQTEGMFSIILPLSIIEPICNLLQQTSLAPKDSSWQLFLAEHLQQTSFMLDVVLDQADLSLGDVIAWKVGSHVSLVKGPESCVTVSCIGTSLFKASIGHKGPQIAISIDEVLI